MNNIDRRWTVTREHTGNPRPVWVLRFCGDWSQAYPTRAAAVAARDEARAMHPSFRALLPTR